MKTVFNTSQNDDRIELPDGAEPLTIGWWHNRFVSPCRDSNGECMMGHCGHTAQWTKCISFTGSYEDNAPVGGPVTRPDWDARWSHKSKGKHWEGDEHGHQHALILGRRYGYFVDDVDNAELYESEAALAQFITRDDAMSTRGDHWHALVWVPPELRHLWPDRNVPGADIKGAGDGFVPVPGSVHYSGALYEPVPNAKVIVATEAMLYAIRTQPVTQKAREAGYTGGAGSANGRQGQILKELMSWVGGGLSKDECRERWFERKAELDALKNLPLTPEDPEDFFEHQYAWCERNRDRGERAQESEGWTPPPNWDGQEGPPGWATGEPDGTWNPGQEQAAGSGEQGQGGTQNRRSDRQCRESRDRSNSSRSTSDIPLLTCKKKILAKMRAEGHQDKLSVDWKTAPNGCRYFYEGIMRTLAAGFTVTTLDWSIEYARRWDDGDRMLEWLTSDRHPLLKVDKTTGVILAYGDRSRPQAEKYPGWEQACERAGVTRQPKITAKWCHEDLGRLVLDLIRQLPEDSRC